MKIKLLMIATLLFSGCMAYAFEDFSKGFVIYAPYGEYVYMKDIQGSISDGGSAVGTFGIFCLIVGCILIFIKNTKYLSRIGFSVFIFLLLTLMMIEGDSIDQLVINTIQYDHNIFLILWCISLALYTVLFTVLNIKHKPKEV